MSMDMEYYFIFILFLLWLLFSFLLHSFLKGYKNMSTMVNLPPSPPSLPLLGHLHLIGPLPHLSFQSLGRRYGPLIGLRLGSLGTVLSVSSPSMAKELFKTHHITFASRPQMAGLEFVGNGDSRFVFASYGPYWKFMKMVCANQLFSRKKLDRTVKIRQQEIQWLLGCLLEKSRAGEAANIEALLTALTNNIICRIVMSSRCSGSMNEAEDCKKVVQEVIEIAGKLNLETSFGFIRSMDVRGYGKRLSKVHESFMVMMERIMKEHEVKQKINGTSEEANEEDDLMDILLKISREENSEVKLSRDDIKVFLHVSPPCSFKIRKQLMPMDGQPGCRPDQPGLIWATRGCQRYEMVVRLASLITIGLLNELNFCQDLFIAGTETTSATMQWAVAELINHPLILNKLRQVIDSVVENKRLVQESDLPHLPYLHALLMETLRLHPAVPLVLRVCNRNCKIAGFDIAEGTQVCINVWAINRDPSEWDAPEEFLPERFLTLEGTIIISYGEAYCFLLFGGGRRMCPGHPWGCALCRSVLRPWLSASTSCS